MKQSEEIVARLAQEYKTRDSSMPLLVGYETALTLMGFADNITEGQCPITYLTDSQAERYPMKLYKDYSWIRSTYLLETLFCVLTRATVSPYAEACVTNVILQHRNYCRSIDPDRQLFADINRFAKTQAESDKLRSNWHGVYNKLWVSEFKENLHQD